MPFTPATGSSRPRTYPLDRARAEINKLRAELGERRNYAREKAIVDRALNLEKRDVEQYLTVDERIGHLRQIYRIARRILDPQGEEGVELGVLKRP